MRIEVLYPELCNLYAELTNPRLLARSCGAELIYTGLRDRPRFVDEQVELVYMGTTTERGQEAVRDAFAPYLEALKKRTEDGGVTLITGNAMEIFGQYIEAEGQRIPMLGYLPIHSSRDFFKRYNCIWLGKMGDMDVVGFKSQFGHSYGDVGAGMFTTLRGAGLNPGVKPEGVRINNLMATYLIGPLLVLNPPLAKYVLELMGVENPQLAYEQAATDAYNARVREFSDPNRGVEY